MDQPPTVPATTDTLFALRIVGSQQGRTGERIEVTGTIIIGRDEACTVTLADRGVSRRHASVTATPDGLRVTDLGSGNGVWSRGERILDSVVQPGEQFRIETTVFECVALQAAQPGEQASDRTLFMPSPVGAGGAVPDAGANEIYVRVLTGSDEIEAGRVFHVAARTATIGRGGTCDIVLPDREVSRQHARIEVTASGLRIMDLDSTGGVWIGARQVNSALVEAGKPVRIGNRIVIECSTAPFKRPPAVSPRPAVPSGPTVQPRPGAPVPPSGPPAAQPVTSAPAPSMPGITPAGAGALASPPAAAPTPVAPAAEGAAVPAAAGAGMPAASIGQVRPIASALADEGTRAIQVADVEPAAPAGDIPEDATRAMRVEDLLSSGDAGAVTNGSSAVALTGVEIEEPLAADFEGTVMMPVLPQALLQARRIEEEGTVVKLSAHQPFLLDDPDAVYFVLTGALLIFTVAVDKGQPTGPRKHFLGIQTGQACFGIDSQRYASGFLVVPKPETSVRKLSLRRLQAIAARADQAAAVTSMLDTWVAGLSKSLIRDLTTKRTGEIVLKAGQAVELGRGQKATTDEQVVWASIWSGSVLFDDMATPVFPRKRTLFPITPHSWVQLVSDEFGDLSLAPRPTAEVIADPQLWYGLTVLHDVLCECEFINKKLAQADEYVRLQQKARHSEAAEEAAYDAIGSVMQTEGESPRQFLATTGAEPVLRACSLVGQAAGIVVRPHPAAHDEMPYEEQVAAIATASGFRTRVVALRDDWYRYDHGPVLGQEATTKAPRALLPKTPRSYAMVDPASGAAVPLAAEPAATLAPFGYTFYRPLPEGAPSVMELLRFGGRFLGPDLKVTVALAMIIGMFGTVTPYLIGQLFSTAIPQADTQALYVFGATLVAAAVATSIFKFVQGVATVRVQSRMQAAVQAGIWDRLLNLPTTFFRAFEAGDLSDRVGGIDQIQALVAGAGVSAVLGSVSGVFYVFQMFGYSLRLALVAIVLTAIFVGANMFANYMQLRYQRVEMQLRGRISGLVLNLISGVSKLRICGAESHAFRVWASAFSQQRKITFTVGNIQNAAAVFSSVFPVLSSMMIFYTLISAQESGGATITTGQFIAFNAAYGLFLAAMQALGDASLNLLRVVPIYERLSPVIETTPEVDSSKAFPGPLKGGIELSHVSFRYTPDGPLIVNDVSLKIKPGEFVAFVGSSGCGKSTLMRLMLGFERPAAGTIYFDGQDLASLDLRMVRQQMGVVLQVSRVMPTEMYRNIIGATSRPMEDAWAAAEKAGLADDIRNMPMGMHTYVSEGGGTLSGGQRQRLMIARAIVNRPKILFLDEATSALDNRSQAIVTESMDRMDATRIVIAHRLSTIANADRICYLDAGRIVEMGTYDELMAKDGLFAQLAKRQVA